MSYCIRPDRCCLSPLMNIGHSQTADNSRAFSLQKLLPAHSHISPQPALPGKIIRTLT